MKRFNIYTKIRSIFKAKRTKKQAELDYWTNLVNELTKDCKKLSQKQEKLLNICYEITYPRYKKDLYLNDDSFKGKKLLDLGCGPHGGLIGFTDCDKYGVDHLIEEYKIIGYPLDKHGIKYYQAKSEKLPFPDSYFDVVVCVNALDHVDSLKETLKEMARVLRKGGIFMGQINFHPKPTLTEPLVLNHQKLVGMLSQNNLILVKRIFQCHLNQENRYYYESKKI